MNQLYSLNTYPVYTVFTGSTTHQNKPYYYNFARHLAVYLTLTFALKEKKQWGDPKLTILGFGYGSFFKNKKNKGFIDLSAEWGKIQPTGQIWLAWHFHPVYGTHQ